MSPSKNAKPTPPTAPAPAGGAGVGISPPRHDQLGRPTPPTSRPAATGLPQPRSTPTSPATNISTGSPTRKPSSPSTGSGFRPNNPFAQRQYQRQQAQLQSSPRLIDASYPALTRPAPLARSGANDPHSPSPLSSPLPVVSLGESISLIPTLSPPTNNSNTNTPTQPLAVAPRRRIPVPEDAMSPTTPSGPTPPGRRPVPAMSPEMSGIPRLTSPPQQQSPRMGQGLGLGIGNGQPMGLPSGMGMNMPVPRPAMRQPSTPALLAAPRKPISDPSTPSTRPRAKSTASQQRQGQGQSKLTPSPTPLSIEREAAVPPHIRVRLRLIHRLGAVLGVEASVIAAKIDIPGLLARVDAAYDRGHGGYIDIPGQEIIIGPAGTTVVIPPAAIASPPQPGGKKEGGMMGMFRKLGGGVSSSNLTGNASSGGKGTKEESQPLMTSGSGKPAEEGESIYTFSLSGKWMADKRSGFWGTII
jgi:hypothetical protein